MNYVLYVLSILQMATVIALSRALVRERTESRRLRAELLEWSQRALRGRVTTCGHPVGRVTG